jgi:hypothetical protein
MPADAILNCSSRRIPKQHRLRNLAIGQKLTTTNSGYGIDFIDYKFQAGVGRQTSLGKVGTIDSLPR